MKYEAWEKLAHRYNDQWVQKYSLRPTRREVKKLVLPLLEKNNDLKILDIGSGTGQLISEISEQFPFVDYLGIDVAKNMIGVAKENNSGERIRFMNVSVDDFSCSEKIVVIICTHAFPYFPDKKRGYAENVCALQSGWKGDNCKCFNKQSKGSIY